MVEASQIMRAMPSAQRAEEFAPALTAALFRFEIGGLKLIAAFLAQCLHESQGFAKLQEGLSYSAERLMAVWPRRFPSIEIAEQYTRNPEKLANFIYRGRMGNSSPGDGWKFRARGPIGITGLDNYRDAGEALGLDLVASPDLLLQPMEGCLAAAWYFKRAGCCLPQYADDFDAICDLVNIGRKTEREGDAIGYADRLALFGRLQEALAC